MDRIGAQADGEAVEEPGAARPGALASPAGTWEWESVRMHGPAAQMGVEGAAEVLRGQTAEA